MKQTIVRILICLAAIACFTGCKGKQDTEGKANTRAIAVIPKGTTHEFWKSVHAGAVKAGQEFGIEIIWKGPLREDDRESQISEVENFISRGVEGIVLAPLDDVALSAPVANADRCGIPVVIIDSALRSDEIVSFVATDNYEGGKMAGRHLAELIGKKGSVAMLRYAEGSASTMKREQGFLDAIKDFPEIKVVSANQHGGATTETAYKASENMLAPLKSKDGTLSIQGVFCPNESTTFGMLRALQDNKFAGKVNFVGFDSSVKLVEALHAGEINALVLQNPLKMGYLGVRTMVEHLDGKTVPKRIDTGVTLVTPENADTPEIREILSPDLSKWLSN